MTKADLAATVAQQAGLTKADAERAVNAMISTINQTLIAGGKVTLVGFGTFSVTNRAARTGRNPQTGQTIAIAPTKVARFKPSRQLKDAVAD